MNVHFETKKAFSIAGLTAPNSQSGDFSGLWNKLFAQVPHEILTSLGSGESFGTCYNYHTIPNNFNYMAGYSALLPEKAREMGLEVLDIPEAEYAIIKLTGPIPASIHRGWEFVFDEFFPSHGLRHAGTPDHEYYLPGDMQSSDYKMELWVPITRE